MRATFQCDGTRTQLVGEWTLKPYAPTVPVFDVQFQADGSNTAMVGTLYRYRGWDEFLIDGSMTQFVGRFSGATP